MKTYFRTGGYREIVWCAHCDWWQKPTSNPYTIYLRSGATCPQCGSPLGSRIGRICCEIKRAWWMLGGEEWAAVGVLWRDKECKEEDAP